MNFTVGDVVQLKSDGPKMTIQKIIGVNTSKKENFVYTHTGHAVDDLICQWFNGDKLETDIFKPQTLRKVE